MTAGSPPPIHYETAWLVDEAGARQHITDTLLLIRQRLGLKGAQVVELGSGIGTNLRVFAPDNAVTGVEGMPEAVAESLRRGIRTLRADLEAAIPLPSSSADLVLSIDVLEHLMNPKGCLLEASRLLRPDGYLVVNVPNHFDWRGRLRLLCGSGIDTQRYFPDSPHWAYPHVRFFDRRSIEALLNSTGFSVVEDFSVRYLSFPKAHVWRRMGLSGTMLRLRERWPDLFTSGFFLLCKKA